MGNARSMEIARKYVFHRMPKVKGYLSIVDALSIASILIGQSKSSLSGAVAEIGVYFGRSFYLMAMLLNRHEKALAIDLFNIGESPGQDSEQLKYFLATGERMGIRLDRDMIVAGDAKHLSAADVLARTGRVRFFSIDGGHELDDVLHDSTIAANTIADYGVICFDDFCNPEWPEVTLAIYEFLKTSAHDLVPFLVSQKKLFLCRPQYRDFYRQIIESASGFRRVKIANVNLLGHRTLVVRSSQREYLRSEAFARSGLGRLNTLFY